MLWMFFWSQVLWWCWWSWRCLLPPDQPPSSRVSSPHVTLTGTCDEAQQEARRWLVQLLSGSCRLSVSVWNNFILHLGEKEQKQLRQIARGGASVEEWFDCGHARMTVRGSSPEDVAVAALQVEAMLCDVVDEFVREEERLLSAPAERLHFQRTAALSPVGSDCLEAVEALRGIGLNTVKVDTTFWHTVLIFSSYFYKYHPKNSTK